MRPLSYSPSPDQRARANWLTGSSLVLLFGSFVVFQMFGWLSAPAFLLQEYALVSGVLFLGIGLFAGWGRKSNTINVVEVTMSSGKVHTLVFQDLQTAWDVAQAIGLAIAGRSPYPRISVTQTGSPEA